MNQKMLAVAVLSVALWSCGTAMPVADAGSGGGTATGGGTAGTGGGTGTGGGGGTAAATCSAYCTTIMANCTAGNAQYANLDSCLGACAAFPAGTVGAMSGNNLECRAYHATNAAGAGAAVHCPHAGPAGDGVCGGNCESFCTVALAKCPSIFADQSACTTACNGFGMNMARYNSSAPTGNTFTCREYHLSVAATDAAQAAIHCAHIATTSVTCN